MSDASEKGEVLRRLEELQSGGHDSDVDRAERSALYFLHLMGVETLASTINVPAESKNRWAIWAAESIAWTADSIRRGEWKYALRGWGKLREEVGRNGGYLPCGLSDHVTTLGNIIEKRLAEATAAPGVLIQRAPVAEDPVKLSKDEERILLYLARGAEDGYGLYLSVVNRIRADRLIEKGLVSRTDGMFAMYKLTEAGRGVVQMVAAT